VKVLKVVLTDPQYYTCGKMVFAFLDKKNIKEVVLKNVENRLTKVYSSLGNFLKTHAVSLKFLYMAGSSQ